MSDKDKPIIALDIVTKEQFLEALQNIDLNTRDETLEAMAQYLEMTGHPLAAERIRALRRDPRLLDPPKC